MATNVFIHGVGQVTGEAKTDIELLSSSDLVSEISTWPSNGVFYEVDKNALNTYYDYMFGSNSGLVSSDFDADNTGDVATHKPILYIKDLVTDMTTDNATKAAGGKAGGATGWWANYSADPKFKVLVNDEYTPTDGTTFNNYIDADNTDNKVSLKNALEVYEYIEAIKADVQRIFGTAFDISTVTLTHQDVAGDILNNFIISDGNIAGTTDPITTLRIENVEELQQMVDSSDGEGHDYDAFPDTAAGDRTLSALFLTNDIFKFVNGVKYEFTVQIPDYNPKEIYTSTNGIIASKNINTLFGSPPQNDSRWSVEELTEFGSHTDFKLVMYQDLFIVVK